MTRDDILTNIGTMKSELYVLCEEAKQIHLEIEAQQRMNMTNIALTVLAASALAYHERELRLHDLVTFCNTGSYPE